MFLYILTMDIVPKNTFLNFENTTLAVNLS